MRFELKRLVAGSWRLEDGWLPRAVARPGREKRVRLDQVPLSYCAKRLAQARKGKKQKAVRRVALPLFE